MGDVRDDLGEALIEKGFAPNGFVLDLNHSLTGHCQLGEWRLHIFEDWLLLMRQDVPRSRSTIRMHRLWRGDGIWRRENGV
jgi:hypothetical protein